MLHAFGKLEVGYREDKIIKLNNQLIIKLKVVRKLCFSGRFSFRMCKRTNSFL